MKRQPISYTLTQNRHSGIGQLVLAIVEPRQFTKPEERNCIVAVQVTWLHDDDRPGHWFARTVAISLNTHEGSQPARMARAAKIIAKLLPDGSGESPEDALRILHDSRAERVAYDARLSRHVTEKTRPDPALIRWMDDFNRIGTHGCTVATLALDAESAAKALLGEYASLTSQAPTYNERFERWKKEGCPVLRDTMNSERYAQFPSEEALLAGPLETR